MGPRRALYTVRWKSARASLLDTEHFGGEMNGVEGEIFDRSGVASTFAADSALADKASNNLKLTGHVRLVSKQPVSTLTCDGIAWDPDREIVRATGNVSVSTPSYWVGGYPELWASPSQDQVATPAKYEFKNVHKSKP